MDPSRNNMPLQFNRQKNQPPMGGTRGDAGNPEDDVSSSTNTMNMANMAPNNGNMVGQGSLGDQNGLLGAYNMVGSMIGPMQPGDPNMMMMGQMGQMNFQNMGEMNMMGNNNMGNMMGPQMAMPGMIGPGMGPANMMGPMGPGQMMLPLIKEVIRLKSSVLYPPPPGAPPRSTRERPPGCRTIFIGGLPEKITEDLLFEVFESCGPIQSIRISKKNFAHVRFEMMESVDRALYISGYRMKIGDCDEKEDTGRLHVDFALARDDQHEFECQQRALARNMRHFQRMEQDRLRPPSPPSVVFYSDSEATELVDQLKSDETFQKASQTLMTWLERGECNRRTAPQFYLLVQTAHSNLRRLKTDKQGLQAEYEQYRMQYDLKLEGIAGQLSQVERVMAAAHKQKCWDHFTKAQRKNVDTWLRQAQEARGHQEPGSGSSNKSMLSVDMELSDDEEIPAKKQKTDYQSDVDAAEMQKLKEENDALKCQMEAFKNEVHTVKLEGQSETDNKDKQVKSLQNALQGMQQQLIAQRACVSKLDQELEETKEKLVKTTADLQKQKTDTNKSDESTLDESGTVAGETSQVAETQKDESSTLVSSSGGSSLSDKEARILGLVCCFLHVHPNGATVDYLWSYLRQLMSVRVREVEDLLEKIPAIFQQKVIGVGAATERRWTYTGMSGCAE